MKIFHSKKEGKQCKEDLDPESEFVFCANKTEVIDYKDINNLKIMLLKEENSSKKNLW